LPAAAVASLPGLVKATESGASGWTLDTHAPNRLLAELVRRADELQSDLMDVELRRPSLEDVFIELTGRPWVDGSGV
jgi:hypothetical protein